MKFMNQQTYTITKIYRSFKDKAGNELKTKDGRSYERVAIKTVEMGDKYISGFGADWNKNWKIGDQVQIIVEQKGEYLNFSKLTENDLLNLRMDKLEKEVEELKKFVLNPGSKPDESPVDDNEFPESADDIPF